MRGREVTRPFVLVAVFLLAATNAAAQWDCQAGGPPCRSPNCSQCVMVHGRSGDSIACEYSYHSAACGCGWDPSWSTCTSVGTCHYMEAGGCELGWLSTRNGTDGSRERRPCWPWEPRRPTLSAPVTGPRLPPAPAGTVPTTG